MESPSRPDPTQRLLDLMIQLHLYPQGRSSCRGLISNASDAVDKLAYKALTDDQVGLNRSDFQDHPDSGSDPKRTLTISDSSIGADQGGAGAESGHHCQSGSPPVPENRTLAARTRSKGGKADVDIISRFGVGFYSAFMVADEVTVTSRAYSSEEAWRWTSDSRTATPWSPAGGRIRWAPTSCSYIKANTEDGHYDEYLEQYRLSDLVKKVFRTISTTPHRPYSCTNHAKPRPEVPR